LLLTGSHRFGGPWTDGDYPASLKETLGDLLPTFTDDEKAMIKGSCDFYAIDAYTGYYGYTVPDYDNCVKNTSHPNYPTCAVYEGYDPDGFPVGPASDPGSSSWLWSTPKAVRRYLNKITKELFPTVTDIAVTEFGFSEPLENDLTDLNTILWDLRRSDYFQYVSS
jgi:WD repeat-containing protein 26